MKVRCMIVIGALTLLLTGLCADTLTIDFIRLMTAPQQKQAGLHRLTSLQRKALNNAILDLILRFAMGDSSVKSGAVEYLKNDGWEEVTVQGTITIASEEYLVVNGGIWTYVLEPYGYIYLQNFQAGEKYLGKMGFVSCEIMDADGDVTNFWTESTK